MQRRFTSQSDFRAVDKEDAWIAKGRASYVTNLGSGQEAQLHQAPRITVRHVDGVDNAVLAQTEIRQGSQRLRRDR